MAEDIDIKVARLEERLDASNNSLRLAREALEKRLEGMNEFRDTLKDQASNFVTRKELLGFISTSMFLTIAIITLILKIFPFTN